jgi:hypothetical protein
VTSQKVLIRTYVFIDGKGNGILLVHPAVQMARFTPIPATPTTGPLRALGGVAYVTGVATLAKPLFIRIRAGMPCPRTLVLAVGSHQSALGVVHDGLGVGHLELVAVREAHDPGVGARARRWSIVSSVWMEG